MRYIADSDGYVKEVSFGADIACGDQICTEYTGSVPTGYASLEAWLIAEADKLYRWKIVDGELTLDSTAVAPAASTLPSFLKIIKEADKTDYSTAYNYFDPLGTTVDSYGIGEGVRSGTLNFATYGDRSDYTVRGIYVGAGVKSVRISASVRYMNNDTATPVVSTVLYKRRGDSSSALDGASDTFAGTGRLTHKLTTITDIQEGDFIYLQSYKSNAARDIDVIADYKSTQLVVEAIR